MLPLAILRDGLAAPFGRRSKPRTVKSVPSDSARLFASEIGLLCQVRVSAELGGHGVVGDQSVALLMVLVFALV